MTALSTFLLRRRRRAELRIMEAFMDKPGAWHHGLDLMRRARLRAGRFYPTLQHLEGEGLIKSRWSGDALSPHGYRRRVYKLTSEGLSTQVLTLEEELT